MELTYLIGIVVLSAAFESRRIGKQVATLEQQVAELQQKLEDK